MVRLLWIVVIIHAANSGYGQIGGQRSFEFLNVPTNARTAGLGNVNVSIKDQDVNLALQNPGLANPEMHNHISVNYILYLADLKYSSLTYAREFERLGTWTAGLQFMNYGKFDGYDPAGNPTGTFKASEFALTIGHSHQVGPFSLGANLRFASSSIAEYSASALMLDLGGVFEHPTQDFNVALVFKNLGLVLGDYTGGSNSTLPFDIQIGTSFKPEHMPIRFSATIYNLHQGDIAYFDPSGDGEPGKEEPGTIDKIFRHFVFGAEILLSENFQVRAGYNHLIRRELRLQQTSGGAGLTFGFMFRVKSFELAYTRALYNVAGGANYFTLSSNLNSFFKNKNGINDD